MPVTFAISGNCRPPLQVSPLTACDLLTWLGYRISETGALRGRLPARELAARCRSRLRRGKGEVVTRHVLARALPALRATRCDGSAVADEARVAVYAFDPPEDPALAAYFEECGPALRIRAAELLALAEAAGEAGTVAFS